jgi:sugar phosphate isomerase/epimerase
MQLGFVSAILAELSLEEVFTVAAETGYQCVEVMCWPVGKAERKYAGVTHLDVTDFTSSKADDTHALCDEHGVTISALGYYPNILTADAEESRRAIEHLKRVIVASQLLGLRTANTFIGADPNLPAEDNLQRYAQVWPDIVRFAEDHGVRLGIENCPMLFTRDEWPSGKNLGHSPAIWRRMFEIIPSDSLGLNYDPSHMIWQMMDYIEPIYEFRHKLFHVHAKDMKIDQRKLNAGGILSLGWSVPKIPGLGDVNWARFLSALSDVGYDGPICVEVEDVAYAPAREARETSLRISRNVLRPLVG